ncbi:hypothetical protein CDD83_6149 [Cordyceps sp. RAO-2017]|nr:hypothetical protein CDD83_6149 [Cordyceps sp. RAO-2017]
MNWFTTLPRNKALVRSYPAGRGHVMVEESHALSGTLTVASRSNMFDRSTADPAAPDAKSLHLDLSTLSPFVSGSDAVKLATPLRDLEARNIKNDEAFLVSCTNVMASASRAAARAFREATGKGHEAQGSAHRRLSNRRGFSARAAGSWRD